mmetsp:Transcript_29994/g.51822  ORF Transcript_29994/g.51822 Transcript_29994/m.51822 type:complete len:86 (-) Transcript_29994:60-317(-)
MYSEVSCCETVRKMSFDQRKINWVCIDDPSSYSTALGKEVFFFQHVSTVMCSGIASNSITALSLCCIICRHQYLKKYNGKLYKVR